MNEEKIQKHKDPFTAANRLLTIGFEPPGGNRFDSRKYNTTEHWGQRKLLLTEIEFLTNYGLDESYLVIYVGAASCVYLEYLSSLFPDLYFRLYDTKRIPVRQTNRIEIQSEPFSDQLARRYAVDKKKILFICNVRTFGETSNPDSLVMRDMQSQKTWCEVLQPQASLLNFRLILSEQKTKYFQGDLVIEPWASKRTNECRLVVTKTSRSINYDTQKFLNSLQYFHHVDRVQYYDHDMDSVATEGLDHCYDCRAEIFILHEYLTKVKRYHSNTEIRKEIARMSHAISEKIEDPTRPQFLARIRTLNIADNQKTSFWTTICYFYYSSILRKDHDNLGLFWSSQPMFWIVSAQKHSEGLRETSAARTAVFLTALCNRWRNCNNRMARLWVVFLFLRWTRDLLITFNFESSFGKDAGACRRVVDRELQLRHTLFPR